MRTTTAPIFSRKDRRRIAAASLLTLAVGVGNIVTAPNASAAPPIPIHPLPTVPVHPTVPPVTLAPRPTFPPVVTLPPIDPCLIRDCDDDPPIAIPPRNPCLRPDAPASRCPDRPERPENPCESPRDPNCDRPDRPEEPGDPGQPEEPGDPGKSKDQPKASVDEAIPARPTFTG